MNPREFETAGSLENTTFFFSSNNLLKEYLTFIPELVALEQGLRCALVLCSPLILCK